MVAIAKFLGTFVCTILASAGVAAVAPLIAGAVARTREGVGAALLAGCCRRRSCDVGIQSISSLAVANTISMGSHVSCQLNVVDR